MVKARTPLAVRILAVPATVAVLVLGLYVVAGRISNDYDVSVVLAVVWFIAASAVLGKLVKRFRPGLRQWVRTGTIATSVAVLAWFYWTSIRETEVSEQIVTAAPTSAGGLTQDERARRARGEPDRGTRGRRGQNLQVAAGQDFVALGDLKGSKGNQQYRVPAGTSLGRCDRVVFWCVPFSQALAQAQLRSS